MWHLKIIIIGLLLMTVGNAYAWSEEGGYEEGESVTVSYIAGQDYTTNDDPEVPFWLAIPLELIYDIFVFFHLDLSGNPDNLISVTYEVEREVWNPETEEYEADTDGIWGMSATKNVSWNANVSTETTFTENPIYDVVVSGTSSGGNVDDITTTDDDPNHPDVFNTTVTISGGGVDMTESGYVALTDNILDSIAGQITNPDYGFDTEGRGSGGSSGGIYEGINMYGSSGGDTTGMGAGFYTIFWCIIPLVFILSVMKLASRCLK